MLSLLTGLAAALAWGLHDLLVRRLAPGAAVLPLFGVVLAVGVLLLLPVTLIFGGLAPVSATTLGACLAAGAAYVLGGGGLYIAFSLAPVRIVAPVVGAYPLLTLGLAVLRGKSISTGEWLAVAVVVVGIALVSVFYREAEDHAGTGHNGTGQDGTGQDGTGHDGTGHDGTGHDGTGQDGTGQDAGAAENHRRALVWALAGAVGFALTFFFAQIATEAGGAASSILLTRLSALAILLVLVLARRPDLSAARANLPVLTGLGILDAAALGLVQWAGGLPHPEYAAVAASLFGVIAILLARIFLHEKVSAGQWLGILVVFAGIGGLSAGL